MTALKLYTGEDFLDLRASLPFSQAHPSPSFHTLEGIHLGTFTQARWLQAARGMRLCPSSTDPPVGEHSPC